MVIHGKQLFVNYLFVKQFTYYSFFFFFAIKTSDYYEYKIRATK